MILAPVFTLPALGFMLFAAAAAPHAVLEIACPFLSVLALDARRRVLVAAVASVFRVIGADVTGNAFGPVVSVEAKILVVIEGRRPPSAGRMAELAIVCRLTVQGFGWLLVAARALLSGRDS